MRSGRRDCRQYEGAPTCITESTGQHAAAFGVTDDLRAERLARLEGAYEHLATKADLKDLELRLTSNLRSLETRLTVRLMLVVSLATGVVVAVDRLWS